MNTIHIGAQIRALRKEKGLTQEALATALSVSPQAVSKWESGISYPDMVMIPLIAGFFDVSLDTLFDFDVKKTGLSIEKLLKDSRELFYSDPDRYQSVIKTALQENPGNESLMCALLDSYEHSLVCYDRTDLLNEMIELSYRIISTSRNYVKVCTVKENLAAAYLKSGQYEKAKAILGELPEKITLRYDAMAYRLSGEDRIFAAEKARDLHLQGLYIACFYQGHALFEKKQYASALDCYRKGLSVLTTFLRAKTPTREENYLWKGMQTFHWGFLLHIGACHAKLGDRTACDAQVNAAYQLIRAAWTDFEARKDYYMEGFIECLRDCGLEDYIERL